MRNIKVKEMIKDIDIDDFSRYENKAFASMKKQNFGWYRPADNDEFPVGTYMESVTGRGIKYYFKSSGSSNNRLCHNVDDANTIIKKYNFSKVYAQDYYEDEDKIIYSRNVYELVTDDGMFVLSVSNVPNLPFGIKGKKSSSKDNVYIGLSGNGKEELYEEIRNEIISSYRKPAVPPNNVYLVVQSHGGYDVEMFDLPKQKIDIELNYGSEFIPIHKKIIETLNTQKSKGLVLLHGEPGTGKTHYLKYIASKVKDKKVLFIPPFLAEFITSPQMTPFLIDNANSVLFIEDAERVITDRNENGSNGVSNILNITDGILSDILNIQIVATFNMDKKKIDSALLRKGRLIAEHRFDALSVEDSNKLLKHLGSDYVTSKEMTLTEIYNYKDEHYVSEEKRTVIGFRPR
jgi:hypothetical protein